MVALVALVALAITLAIAPPALQRLMDVVGEGFERAQEWVTNQGGRNDVYMAGMKRRRDGKNGSRNGLSINERWRKMRLSDTCQIIQVPSLTKYCSRHVVWAAEARPGVHTATKCISICLLERAR